MSFTSTQSQIHKTAALFGIKTLLLGCAIQCIKLGISRCSEGPSLFPLSEEEITSNRRLQQQLVQRSQIPQELELLRIYRPKDVSEGPVTITFESDTQYSDHKLSPRVGELLRRLLDNSELLEEESILARIIAALPAHQRPPKDRATVDEESTPSCTC